jgi:very-short-patch-repair endonuclease
MSNAHGELQRQQLLAAHAHRMRGAPSEPERVLWVALRSCRFGVRFRRQVVWGSFILDFFAPSARLVVEVDGAQHVLRWNADKRRDKALESAGLRVPAALVQRNASLAVRLVREALSPSPSSR